MEKILRKYSNPTFFSESASPFSYHYHVGRLLRDVFLEHCNLLLEVTKQARICGRRRADRCWQPIIFKLVFEGGDIQQRHKNGKFCHGTTELLLAMVLCRWLHKVLASIIPYLLQALTRLLDIEKTLEFHKFMFKKRGIQRCAKIIFSSNFRGSLFGLEISSPSSSFFQPLGDPDRAAP